MMGTPRGSNTELSDAESEDEDETESAATWLAVTAMRLPWRLQNW